MRKAILFIVLALSAQIANADTYPASVSVGVFPSTCGSEFSSGIECYRRYKCELAGYNPDTIASTIPLYTSYCPRPAFDLTEDSGYYHVTWNWGETSNLAYRSENFLKTYSCPHGGTLSGTSCINAPSCTAPQVRDTTTGECKTPVTCQTVPATTTSGSTQTMSWETLNSTSDGCDPHSLNCDYPLVANATTKQCDLSCPDGSTVDVSSGAQCPPPSCPTTVHGNMIIKQTWDQVTQTCKNSDIVYCDGQRETPDSYLL